MLYYDRIEVSERIYINKTIVSKQCNICHYWYFLDTGFMFQLNICQWLSRYTDDVYES